MNVNWDCFGNFNCLKERNLSLQGGETTGKDGEGKPCIPGDKRKPWKHPAPGRKSKSKHDKYKERLKMSGRPGHIFYEIPRADLHPDPHYPSYNLGQYSSMVSKVWGNTRVRVRRYSGDKEALQNRELEVNII
ncbi:uncharacterized protein LOC111702718 [Eurytemora carolleeae]|uniref:uncharacterized protein LOC111702718 n=1 Tax=Eurytemora carolleeae TaxID=1294199 RepID=UPI000C761B5C|nr:uncharacterized protein LOC111702718 [Eurytemora carolleeae]|eukprot:XP_023330257.1 uncharacterized protein LOC111702718 [Eurytemora affinis]